MGIVLYCKGLGTIPTVLNQAYNCKYWGVLPNSGGAREQPAGLLTKMQSAINMHKAYTMFRHAPAGKGNEVANRHPQAFALFSQMEAGYREWKKAQDNK